MGSSAIFARLLNRSAGLTTIIACDGHRRNLRERASFHRPNQCLRSLLVSDGPLRPATFRWVSMQIGRVTGKAQINFGYPVFDDEGRLRAVLSTAIRY